MAKRDHAFKFYLKGGIVLDVEANNLTIKIQNGSLISYSLEGIDPTESPMFIDLDSVVAIEQVR